MSSNEEPVEATDNNRESEPMKPEITQSEINRYIADLRRHLKTYSKNDLIRIVIDNTLTLYSLKTRIEELSQGLNDKSTEAQKSNETEEKNA